MQEKLQECQQRLENKGCLNQFREQALRLLVRLRVVVAVDLEKINPTISDRIAEGLDPDQLTAQREKNARFQKDQRKWRGR